MLDRDGAVSAWRRAEGRIYPSVMMNAALYQEYVAVVQGHRRGARRRPQRGRSRRRVARAPRPRADGDRPPGSVDGPAHGPRGGARRGVLPSPPRGHARARQGARRAAPRRGQAHRRRVGHVVRRRDPARRPASGDARPQRAGAAHEREPAARRHAPGVGARGRAARPQRRRLAARQGAAAEDTRNSTVKTNGRRASSRPGPPSEETSCDDPPEEDHRRALPHRRDPAVEVLRPRASREADGLRLQGHEVVPQEPHGGVQGRARARHVQLRRADPRAVVRPQRRRAGGGDHERPHPRRDLGVVPAAQRGAARARRSSSPASRASSR